MASLAEFMGWGRRKKGEKSPRRNPDKVYPNSGKYVGTATGKTVILPNGAEGQYEEIIKQDGTIGRRFRFTKGSNTAHLQKMLEARKAKSATWGGKPNPSGKISKEEAIAAFKKQVISNLRFAHRNKRLAGAYKAAATNDLRYSNRPRNVKSTIGYKYNTRKGEYPDVDFGGPERQWSPK